MSVTLGLRPAQIRKRPEIDRRNLLQATLALERGQRRFRRAIERAALRDSQATL